MKQIGVKLQKKKSFKRSLIFFFTVEVLFVFFIYANYCILDSRRIYNY